MKQPCGFCHGKPNPAKFKIVYWREPKYDWDEGGYLTYVSCGVHLYRACDLPEKSDGTPVVERI